MVEEDRKGQAGRAEQMKGKKEMEEGKTNDKAGQVK